MKLTLHYEMACEPARFWTTYFDPDYTAALHRQALGSTSMEIITQEGDTAHRLQRTLRYGQRPDAPGPVKRLFGDEVITTELSSFDAAAHRVDFTLTPGTMADKTDISGSIRVEADGELSRQVFELEARVKIFGAGPVVERFIERQARSTQDKAVVFMNEWLGTH